MQSSPVVKIYGLHGLGKNSEAFRSAPEEFRRGKFVAGRPPERFRWRVQSQGRPPEGLRSFPEATGNPPEVFGMLQEGFRTGPERFGSEPESFRATNFCPRLLARVGFCQMYDLCWRHLHGG